MLTPQLLCMSLPLFALGVTFRSLRAPPDRSRSMDSLANSLFGSDGLYHDPNAALEEFGSNELSDASPSFCVFSRIIIQELPYIKSFVKHYGHLGVRKFYFVNNKYEQHARLARFIEALATDLSTHITLHSVHVTDADAALNDMELFRSIDEDFVISVDVDEYWMLPDGISSFGSLVEAHPAATEFRAQWIMVPNDDIYRSATTHYRGFRGANGKWMAKVSSLEQIAVTPHKPLFIDAFVKHTAVLEAGELIHFWGRSFLDQLTKGLGQELHNRADERLDEVHRLMSEGKVPERLRMLAFLLSLDGNMNVDVSEDLLTIDHELEKEIASELLQINVASAKEEAEQIHDVYIVFKQRVAEAMSKEKYPSYPKHGLEKIAPWLAQIDNMDPL